MAAQIRSKDAIPDQAYRKMVLTLMDKQAGREVATAEVFGQACLEEMTRDVATRAEIQRRFKKWFVASIRIFGRAKTPGNQYCIDVGLKTRDSGDIAAAYLDSIRPVMTRCGLRFPDRSELPLELPPQVDLTVSQPALAR